MWKMIKYNEFMDPLFGGRKDTKMRNYWDWERFGEDIRRTVQDAVDSMDFRSLNQTITDTINSATGSFRKNSGNARQTAGGAQSTKKDWAKVDRKSVV